MVHALVVRPDNNGDVLLAGPAVRAVAADVDELTLWVGPRGRHAAELLPCVDRVVVAELPWIDPTPSPVDRHWVDERVDELAALDVHRAFVLTSFHQSPLPTALLLRMAGVPWVAATSVDYPGALLDVRHGIDDDVHEVVRALDLVATGGHRLPPDDDGRLAVRRTGDTNPVPDGAPYVVVHPGASVPARAWGAERNAAAVCELAADGWRVVVTGGPDERELTARVAADVALDLGGCTDWSTLARVIEDAEALVVGNTGPAHLAAAVATPVVTIHAPTVPAVRWRPWRVPHEVLGDQGIACAGCRASVCPQPGHPCISTVPPAEAAAAVRRLVARRPRVGGTSRPQVVTA